MRCEDIQDQLIDVTSPDFISADAKVRAHVETCVACRTSVRRAARAWTLLSALPDEEPDSAAMQARFAATLKREPIRSGRVWTAWRPAYAAAAVIVALVGGAAIGWQLPHEDTVDAQDMIALRAELRDMREMLTLSLMQQTVASERIKGVSSAASMTDPPSDVVAALLDTLLHDSSVNVRLACVRALGRFSEQPTVRAGVVEAVTREVEPLVSVALINFIVEAKDRMAVEALRHVADDDSREMAVREMAARGVQLLSGGRI